MINVNVSNNLQGVQGWDQLAGMVKTGETKAAGGADVRIENDQIVVTVSNGKEMQSVTVSVPDLGAMDDVPDTETLQSIAAKIVALADSLAAAGALNADGTAGPELQASIARLQSALITASTSSSAPGNADGASSPNPAVGSSSPNPAVGSSSPNPAVGASDPSAGTVNTSKALFDLFALMALMVKVAQSQRDASREIRLTENQQIQNSIKQQADEMRSAAAISLAFGIVTSVISGLMSGLSLFKQSKAFSQQSTAVKTMETPTQNLQAAHLLSSPEAAETNLRTVQAKTSEHNQTEALKGISPKEELVQAIKPKKEAFEQAEAEQKAAWKELQDFKANHAADDPGVAQRETAHNEAVTKTNLARTEYSQAERGVFGSLDSKQRMNEALITAKRDEIAAEEAHYAKARGPEVQASRTRLTQLKSELKDLQGQTDYLRAYTTELKAKYGSDTTKADTMTSAQDSFNIAKAKVERNEQYASSQQMMNRWMGIQQLTMTLSQMTNAGGSMISEMVRSKATMEGVEQTQHNEQLDQIKDLFQQAETVVQAVVQLMQAVLSAENESLMEAIRA